MYSMAHYVGDDYVVVDNPTVSELTEAIRSLKEQGQTSLIMGKSPVEHLSVVRCKRQRYAVHYTRRDEKGYLLEQRDFEDATCPDRKSLVPYFEPDGMKEYAYLYQTITLDE